MNQLKSKNNVASKKFTLFILASVFIWFLTKLSKEYDATISYNVAYTDLPTDKLLQEEPVKKIDIHIKTTGFKLISATLFPPKIEINTSKLNAKTATDYYVLVSQQKLAIQRQMRTGVEIDHFISDSINFSLGLLKNKKIPVRVNSNLSYDLGYDMDGTLKITPDSIFISGPESVLDTINYVQTSDLVKNEVHEPIDEELAIKDFSAESNVKLDRNKVIVTANVEKYTEGTIELPFRLINLPEGVSINTYPSLVKVTYRVALSNFNKINETSFVLECDYKMSLENNLTYLVPKLIKKSSLVKNTTIAPTKIDFTTEK
ncbi:MAG: hypothetical protein JXR05_13300 [Flavobacteriaceae bacterium]